MSRLFLYSIWLLLLSMIGGKVVFEHCNPWLFDKKNFQQAEFVIKRGESANTIANNLAQQGFIQSPLWFRLAVRYRNISEQFKTGRYLIDGAFSPNQIISLLISGKVVQYKFTVLEGWRFNDLQQKLLKAGNLKIQILNQSRAKIATALNIPEAFLDGGFLADTYFYETQSSDLQLLKRAHHALLDYYQQQSPFKNKDLIETIGLYETLSLAALIEKETNVEHEREIISGVFHNRLRKNMRLQSDPTVIYALGDKYDGNITRSHLRFVHPYNTYTTKGVPPFPIAYSGRNSIRAALQPLSSNFFYFVATGNGGHYFSTTHKEHQQAVKRYLKVLRSKKTK